MALRILASTCRSGTGRQLACQISLPFNRSCTGSAEGSTSPTQHQPGTAPTNDNQRFDEIFLPFLVCPLTKSPLRWDAARSELICDELGVAYPVMDGVPRLIPAAGRIIDAK